MKTLVGSFFRLGLNDIRPRISRRSALIILALVMIFVSAFMIRVYPAKYGFYLNEFDPFYNYRASQYLVDRITEKGLVDGIRDYSGWVDRQAWYPEGRNVAPSSQVGLHISGAALYLVGRDLLGSTIELYDFLVIFPVFVGSLTTIAMYLLLRRIAGDTAGLFSAAVIALSPPIIVRGNLGWFKSEPFALLIGVFATYLFISVYEGRAGTVRVLPGALASGLLMGFSNTTWGGAQYFSIALALFMIVAPFFGIDLRRSIVVGSLFASSDLLVSALVPRPGPSFVTGPVGALLMSSVAFNIIALLVQRSTQPDEYRRTLGKALFAFLLAGLTVLGFGLLSGVSGRYITVIYPFERTENPLIASVAEHFVPTGSNFFSSYGVLLFLAGFGALQAFRKRRLTMVYSLIFGLAAFYISSSFSRLLVYSSVGTAILAAIGFTELSNSILKPSLGAVAKKRIRVHESKGEVKVLYSMVIIAMIALPAAYPVESSWIANVDIPTSIANSASPLKQEVGDWLEALNWIRENTPQDAIFASWWDYGYWITVMGNRTSLADNATINQTRIAQLGMMFMSDEDEALKILEGFRSSEPDRPLYVLLYIGGAKIREPNTGDTIYILGLAGSGDEGKKQWFIRIAGLNETDYVHDDGFTPRPGFYSETLMGRMIPLEFRQYFDLSQSPPRFVGTDYVEGGTGRRVYPTFTYSEKYSRGDEGPLKLVFVSSSLNPEERVESGQLETFAGVVIYEVLRQP